VEEIRSAGPGNVVFLELESAHVTEVFTGFGQHGVKAERVAGEAVKQMREYLKADVPVGPYLADQLMLPLGISAWQKDDDLAESAASGRTRQRGGAYRTLPLSRHATTHIDLLREFLGVTIELEESPSRDQYTVRVGSPLS
jgi:RNA 3'-terminal phosphate cyclase (ATP)